MAALEKTTSKVSFEVAAQAAASPCLHSQFVCDLRAADIISGELSKPVMRASGQRSTRTCALLPGPHPRSITRRGAFTAMRAAKSRHGRDRSSANLRYCSGFQAGMGISCYLSALQIPSGSVREISARGSHSEFREFVCLAMSIHTMLRGHRYIAAIAFGEPAKGFVR